jgi:hypothetical protein
MSAVLRKHQTKQKQCKKCLLYVKGGDEVHDHLKGLTGATTDSVARTSVTTIASVVGTDVEHVEVEQTSVLRVVEVATVRLSAYTRVGTSSIALASGASVRVPRAGVNTVARVVRADVEQV